MSDYLKIASRIFAKPLAVEPRYAKVFFSALANRLNVVELESPDGPVLVGEKLRISAESFQASRARDRPYRVERGVAVLPVSGSLVHKHGYLQPYSGMTGYDGISARLASAVQDPEVKGILLDIDSPGGEVAGCFDCVEMVRRAAASKPVWALSYDLTASGAMALASGASRRLITQTGEMGSVGVIMAHISRAKELEDAGRKVTLVYSGAHKVDGNPYQDLPDDVLERFQREIDTIRTEFAQLVAINTGLSVDAVMATEAAVYRGSDAVDIGFAHQIVNGFDAVDEFADYLQSNVTQKGVKSMTQSSGTAPVASVPEENSPQQPESQTPAPDASAAERKRISAILNCEHAEGRSKLANHLALNTDLEAEDAIALLAVAEKEKSGTGMQSALEAAMATEEQPNIGPSSESVQQSEADRMISNYAMATGRKH